ncbi:MAG TPA: ABC transporter ATP-binding protein [Salinivirgaceae bacterium]|nr:ABC transporter ATP-binding protein [Salinivirgaceae bacterium]
MILARNIIKKYGELTVLKGIDLEIKPKEVVAIVGPSGAGKTTLLHIIGTLEKPNQGEVYINGVNIHQLNDQKISEFRNKHLGFVFQFHQLLPEFSAIENVCIPAMIGGKSLKEAKPRAQELLTLMGLQDRLNHRPSELSGGEQQRVAVARALMNNPMVVLADEPSGNLDSVNRTQLHNLFFTLRDLFGQTFIIVTHDNELAQMADRIIHMRDGKLQD